jgi:mono/diheme cytochrome c family protein
MKQILTALIFLSPIAAKGALKGGDHPLEIVAPAKTVQVSLGEMKAKLKSHTVTIDDPVYLKQVTYDAFLLSDVFRLAGFNDEDSGDEIVYTAKDGYSPNLPFSAMKKHTPYLAYSIHGKHDQFDLIQQGKTKMSPGPFYVIWSEGAKLGGEVPWPYQLVRIEAVRFKDKFPKLFPDVAADSPEFRGFSIFKSECIRCHSINLQGGDVGPELNIPKNVTEYWKESTLKEFIPNAPSFRAKSKMPAFEKLTKQNVDDLLAYFKFMARHKVQ